MTDNQKIQIIHDTPAIRREWSKGDLTKDEKRRVLEGMDLGVNQSWILSLIEDVRDMRETANSKENKLCLISEENKAANH